MGDALKSPRPRQLPFAFADNRPRDGTAPKSDVSDGRAFLLHKAKVWKTEGLGATAGAPEHLLDRAASSASLANALLHVARKKGAPGVDGQSVQEAVKHSRNLLPRLLHDLRRETYHPGDLRRVWIPKSGGGQRMLGIPNVMDRWVQEAVRQVLTPVLDPDFHPCSHGYRPERGVETALADIERYLAEGCAWVVSIDLSKFFDRVHHQRLLARLSKRVSDKRVLKLINRILKAGVAMQDGVRIPTKEGTPQGGPLSPLLSNVVLDELDWELDRRGLRFVRYADDFLVFVGSERAAHRVMGSVTKFIEGRLRLKVNHDKSSVTRVDDTEWLGFRFRRSPSGSMEVHLSQRSIDRLNARLRELVPRNWGQSLEACMQGVSRYFRGWMSHFRCLTSEGAELLRRFDSHVRRRLRAIIIRHKGRDRHLYRHLRERGVSHRAAHGTAFRRLGFWRRSNLPGIVHAYPVSWFRERVVVLEGEWSRRQPRQPASGQLELWPT